MTAHPSPDRRRAPCRVCKVHPVYAPGHPTCGEWLCRLAWAPGWAPSRKGAQS